MHKQCLLYFFSYVNTVSYGLFVSGHVGEISVYDDETTSWTLVKTECKATMKKKSYNVWVAINRVQGEIETAACECMAG